MNILDNTDVSTFVDVTGTNHILLDSEIEPINLRSSIFCGKFTWEMPDFAQSEVAAHEKGVLQEKGFEDMLRKVLR